MSAILELSPIDTPVRLSLPEGFRTVSTGIGPHGEAIRLYVPTQAAEAVFGTQSPPGGAIFPKTHTEQPYTARVCIIRTKGTTVRELPLVTATYPSVQTLPGDNILVVARRCQRSDNGTHELNARVYRPDGSLESEFCLGDGIEHVQADSAGRLWVGYFDEGVFGNFGWGSSRDATPIGVTGLVCFDAHGKKLWEFEPPPGFDSIADCYAMNVADDAVWVCYYTEFPIVRVDYEHRVTAWATGLRGPRELAVGKDYVLVYGGYGEKRTDCRLVRLRDGQAEDAGEVVLRLPNGFDPKESTVIGRGRLLHVLAGDEWYVFSVPSEGQTAS